MATGAFAEVDGPVDMVPDGAVEVRFELRERAEKETAPAGMLTADFGLGEYLLVYRGGKLPGFISRQSVLAGFLATVSTCLEDGEEKLHISFRNETGDRELGKLVVSRTGKLKTNGVRIIASTVK